MKKSCRALLSLLLALALPLQGLAASGGWWCAFQGHDPLRLVSAQGGAGAHAAHGGHGVAHHADEAPLPGAAAQAGAATNAGHPHVTQPPPATTLQAAGAANAAADAPPDADAALAVVAEASPAHPADGHPGPSSVAGSCSVCAACCTVTALPPAGWLTPHMPGDGPTATLLPPWPPGPALAGLDRPPRSTRV